MRSKILLGVAAALAVGMAAPRSARACGRGGGNYGALYAALGVAAVAGTVDLGLTLWDGGSALVSHHPSTGYGAFELLFAAPQVLLGTVAMGNSLRSSDATFWTVYTLWMGTLTTHAIWTLATQEPPPERFSLGPTYAPVGQQARPGFGLTGRF